MLLMYLAVCSYWIAAAIGRLVRDGRDVRDDAVDLKFDGCRPPWRARAPLGSLLAP